MNSFTISLYVAVLITGYGIASDGRTTFINSSSCTVTYTPSNIPIVFDVPIPKGHSKDELVKNNS